MSNYITVGAMSSAEAAATLGTGTPGGATVTFTGTGTKTESSWTDAAKAILENYYRGKISKQDMEAQQRALATQRQQGGMSQYMPMIAIAGAVLVAILILRK